MEIPRDTSPNHNPYITGTTPESANPNQEQPAVKRGSLDILLVDDDQLSLACDKLLLEREGYRVTAVNSGELALEYAQIRHYDLVLMGLTLPGLSGEHTAQLIRDPLGGAVSPRVPIIALSSQTGDRARKRCLKAGMDEFLPKPIIWEDMQHAIRCVLRGRNKTQAA